MMPHPPSHAGKAGEWRLCLQAYADMRHAGYKADVYTYSSLIQACQCCGSRWKQAVDFFEEMKLAGMALRASGLSSCLKL